MFFTSAFISARFSVNYINSIEFNDVYPGTYDEGLSSIVDVRGDTIHTFTLPWLSQRWWSTKALPAFQLNLESAIACTETTTSPIIYCLVWIAGGEDIQFAFPQVVSNNDWSGAVAFKERKPCTIRRGNIQTQSQVSAIFSKPFVPIAEGCFADIDNGLCHGESLGPITDIMKRYSPLPFVPTATYPGGYYINGDDIDYCPGDITAPVATAQYTQYYTMRGTLWGNWRAAFWAHAGGFRVRMYDSVAESIYWVPTWENTLTEIPSTIYESTADHISRLTIPQVSDLPFGVLNPGRNNPGGTVGARMGVTTTPQPALNVNTLMYLAARDDVQIGFPILPSRIVPPAITFTEAPEKRPLHSSQAKKRISAAAEKLGD